jgi:flavin reductase
MTLDCAQENRSNGSISNSEFRWVMRAMINGVMVITTSHNGRIHGMTATAFSSVSADPPTVLIVVNRSTRTHPIISASKLFAVNQLAENQYELGNRFAGKLENQFEGVDYTLNEHGVPLIGGVASTLECSAIDEINVGTHTIFVGRVLRGSQSNTMPLAYHDGGYKVVADKLATLQNFGPQEAGETSYGR